MPVEVRQGVLRDACASAALSLREQGLALDRIDDGRCSEGSAGCGSLGAAFSKPKSSSSQSGIGDLMLGRSRTFLEPTIN